MPSQRSRHKELHSGLVGGGDHAEGSRAVSTVTRTSKRPPWLSHWVLPLNPTAPNSLLHFLCKTFPEGVPSPLGGDCPQGPSRKPQHSLTIRKGRPGVKHCRVSQGQPAPLPWTSSTREAQLSSCWPGLPRAERATRTHRHLAETDYLPPIRYRRHHTSKHCFRATRLVPSSGLKDKLELGQAISSVSSQATQGVSGAATVV